MAYDDDRTIAEQLLMCLMQQAFGTTKQVKTDGVTMFRRWDVFGCGKFSG
jgi:hypothetical protein